MVKKYKKMIMMMMMFIIIMMFAKIVMSIEKRFCQKGKGIRLEFRNFFNIEL